MSENSENLEELLDRLTARVDRIESRTRRTDNEIGNIQRRLLVTESKLSPASSSNDVPWRRIGGSPKQVDLEDVNPEEEYQLPMDVYTIISVWKMKSSAFWISMLVICVQFLLLALLLVDQVGSTASSSIVVFPSNVPVIVHVSQALATIIAILGQDDLRSAIEIYFDGLPTRFQGGETFQRIGTRQWNFSCALRFLQGFLSVVAAFLLAIQSETVFDVLLNFLGVRFVSELDDLAFGLSTLGYFGESFQLASKQIVEVKFQQDNRNKVDGNRSWFRKYAHVLGVFTILVAVLALYLFIVINQNNGDFSVQELRMEVRDAALPFAVIFNGCYRRSQTLIKHRRHVYEQNGFEREGGKFAYCDNIEGSGEKAWTFSEGESFNPCENFIARTEATTTYNLLEAGENQWYRRDGVAIASAQLSRVLNPTDCGGFDDSFQKEGCDQFDIEGYIDISQNMNRSSSFSKTFVDVNKATLFTYHALKHPIYIGDKSTLEMYELIFFTGQNWILTHPIALDAPRVHVQSIEDYVQNDDEFLLTLKSIIRDGKYVDLVSDTGTSKGPYETPLGRRWFHVIEVEEGLAFDYPSPDQTREKEIKISCAACSESNPCLFDGICREDKTCDCINGGTGSLCQEAPLGDGECNTYFNTALFEWDGGDCCGGTCAGPHCGLFGVAFPFGLDSGKATVDDQGASNLGYGHCDDPSMAPLTIELSDFKLFNESLWISDFSDLGVPFCTTPTINVRCGGVTYLHVPSHVLQNTSDCYLSYEQTIEVPFGSSCEVSTNMGCFGPFCLDNAVSVYYGTSSKSTPIVSATVQSQPQLSFGVPSTCLTEVLLNQSSSIFDLSTPQGMAANTLANDRLSEFLCIRNHNGILERYALAVLNATIQLKSTNWQTSQCHGWGIPAIKTLCRNDTITSVIVGADSYSQRGTIPTEILLLSNLDYLALTGGAFFGTIPRLPTTLTTLELWGNTLSGTIPSQLASMSGLDILAMSSNLLTGTIPTELLQLQNLFGLWLDTNQLSGPIPSELGGIAPLETLTLNSNNLSGEIPLELTNLNLKMCSLDDSFTGGPALPLCSRFDENGDVISEVSN